MFTLKTFFSSFFFFFLFFRPDGLKSEAWGQQVEAWGQQVETVGNPGGDVPTDTELQISITVSAMLRLILMLSVIYDT